MELSAYICRAALTTPIKLVRGNLNTRELLLLRLEHQPGHYRWAEVAPLPQWSKDTFAENKQALLNMGSRVTISNLECAENTPPALSMALHFLRSKTDPTANVVSNVLWVKDQPMPQTNSSIKVKVGFETVEGDVHRINKMTNQLAPQQKIRLDANQSWSYADVELLESRLSQPEKIEYLEQPLLPELSYQHWHKATNLAFAYDEELLVHAINKTEPIIVEGLEAFVIKPTLLGYEAALQFHQLAQENQLKTVISSSFESPFGTALLRNLTTQWQLDNTQGLSTDSFFSCGVDAALWNSSEPPLTKLLYCKKVL